MSVRIRLKRMGSRKRPYYRVVVADSRTPRGGRSLEEIGYYHPLAEEGKKVWIETGRAQAWIGQGAQPSDTVKELLGKVTRTSS